MRDKPLIMIGQDEAILINIYPSSKHSVAPDGTAALGPKDEWSCFVSRNFGFGHQLSQEQFKLMNECRNDQVYLDTEAAMTINETMLKPKLTETPFVYKLEYGKKYKGY